MLSIQVKQYVSDEVQKILQKLVDEELPEGEINFILHVDGAESWSWANIRNNSARNSPIPYFLSQNLSTNKN